METILIAKSKKLMIGVIIALLFTCLIAGCLPKNDDSNEDGKKEVKTEKEDQEKEGEEEDGQSVQGTKVITLYFSDEQAMFLVPEKREVSNSADIAKVAVEELIKGPKEAGHYPTLPQEAKVLSVKIKDGIAEVNFNQDFEADYPEGSTGETFAIYSIVNTLTEFPSVDKVMFLAEGHPLDVPNSNFDLSKSFSRDESKIKSN